MMAENVPSQPSTVCINNNVSVLEKRHLGNAARTPNSAHHLPVLVTPLTVTSAVRQRTFKVLLKVVSKSSKVHKMFTLRNLDQRKVLSIEHLKEVIRAQLKKDVITSDFDVGYISGSNMVSIRTQADLSEVWSEIISGKNLILWCDGLKDNSFNKKRKQCQSLNHDENVSDEEAWQAPKSKKKKTLQEEREERVQSTIEKLKEKHGSCFTPMQVRIWSEMINGGLHSSFEEPPTSSMFTRAGKGCPSKKKEDKNSLSEAVTQAAVAISSALSPRSGSVSVSSGASPAKVIEARSKCYKQLHDLSSLKESGVLTDDEYIYEKDAVLGILRKL